MKKTSHECPKNFCMFHVGIIVANLHEAIANFSSMLGLTFGPVQEVTMIAAGASPGKIKVKVAYSVEGPVHLELIEGNDGGPFSVASGEGIHHVGFWGDDFTSYQLRKRKNKLAVETTIHTMPGDPTYWLTQPAKLHGTRIEFVSAKIRKGMEAWIAGEDVS